jgi:hypothetical protein
VIPINLGPLNLINRTSVPLIYLPDLSALSGHSIGPAAGRSFLLDLGVWARFFIAIGTFVMMARLVRSSSGSSAPVRVRALLAAAG